MIKQTLYCAGITPAIQFAAAHLKLAGLHLQNTPRWDTDHLLLDIPTFRPGSPFSDKKSISTLLNSLPRDTTIWGGNLNHPALEDFHIMDLLSDEVYLTENAAITARCAINLARPLLHIPAQETKVLIIGWGRIGKFLAQELQQLGYHVTIATRSESARQKLADSGFRTSSTAELTQVLSQTDLIFNTAPAPVITPSLAALCPQAIKMDLASVKGIYGNDVIWARGLPGIHAPEESGRLIARTFLRMNKEA